MTDKTQEVVDPDEPTFEGMEAPEKTLLGFGGKSIDRRLQIGDELYLLMRCEIVSDGRSKKKSSKSDGIQFSAGAATTILRELTPSEAAKVAAG